MTRYEHTTAVLQLEKKDFAISRKEVLQGLSASKRQLEANAFFVRNKYPWTFCQRLDVEGQP